MKIPIKNLFSCVGIFFFMLWAYTNAGLSSYVYPSINIKILSVLLSVVMIYCAYAHDWERKSKGFRTSDILFIMTIPVILFNNHNFEHNNYSVEIAYIALVVSYYYLSRMHFWSNQLKNMVFIGGAIFGGVTVVCYFSRSFYADLIWPLFVKNNVYNDLLINYDKGYIAGLTNHISSNGMYLAISCGFVACYLFLGRKTLLKKVFLIMLVFALLLTGKRAHVLFTAGSLYLTYLVYMADKPKSRLVKGIGIILGVTVVFLIASRFVPGMDNFVEKFAETSESGDITKGRANQVYLALGLFSSNPIFGIGWDGFKYWFLTNFGVFLNVHNVYVQLLCETGILGSLVFYTLFIVEARHAVVALKRAKCVYYDDPVLNCTTAVSCFVQFFFLLYCMTGNPLYDPPILYPYIFSCALTDYVFYNY